VIFRCGGVRFQLGSLTIPELRAFLASQGAPSSAKKKADLLAAVEHFMHVTSMGA